MNYQRGLVELYVVGIALAIGAAATAGMWAYQNVKISGLETDVKTGKRAIEQIGQEKASCMVVNTGLEAANTNFVMQVNAQNKAVAAIKQERDIAESIATVAVKKAHTASLEYKSRGANILAQTAGADWCKKWGEMVTDYTTMRQTKP
jgi:hypothetical protein